MIWDHSTCQTYLNVYAWNEWNLTIWASIQFTGNEDRCAFSLFFILTIGRKLLIWFKLFLSICLGSMHHVCIFTTWFCNAFRMVYYVMNLLFVWPLDSHKEVHKWSTSWSSGHRGFAFWSLGEIESRTHKERKDTKGCFTRRSDPSCQEEKGRILA